MQFSHLLTPFLDDIAKPCDVLPLPRGTTLSKCSFNGQLQISLSDTYARRFRRVYGYVADIKLVLPTPFFFPFLVTGCVTPSAGEGTLTPAQLQVVTLIPWRYGATAGELCASFIWVRLNAFTSKAFFRSAVQVIAVGDAVVGYVEPTNGKCQSAQLVSWGPCD